ncbi:MAG: formylmethanofuran--tetrahydromethanopterin N-formyltransferase [Candidatus Altiarchaeota archaeon]
MIVDDTFAEAFGSVYARILVTAKNSLWLNNAVCSVTGYATSTISCDCEAGVEKILPESETPDGRVGAILQFHIPKFKKDAARLLEEALIHRIGNCILTCPTTRVYNACDSKKKISVGFKLGFFGDGFQKEKKEYGRTMTAIPLMMGDFLIEKEFGYADGVMGGNMWLMGDSEDSALSAAEEAVNAISKTDGTITPFPGGACSSGSKVRSLKYKFLIASTNHEYCPTLKGEVESKLPEGVESVSEIIINGVSEKAVKKAMDAAVASCAGVEGLIKVSAGNYGGKLGKHKIPLKQKG